MAKKRQYQKLFVGDPLTINCRTNEQTASSSRLWKKKDDTNPAEEILPNNRSVTRRKNRFYFKSVSLDDAGLYICKATLPSINKTIKEEITSLLVFTGDEIILLFDISGGSLPQWRVWQKISILTIYYLEWQASNLSLQW